MPFDREKARAILEGVGITDANGWVPDGVVDLLATCVVPGDGITLTPEEARTALEGCGNTLSEFEGAWPEADLARFRALEQRLVAWEVTR